MTQTLKAGDRGALVALLQLALERAGQMPGAYKALRERVLDCFI